MKTSLLRAMTTTMMTTSRTPRKFLKSPAVMARSPRLRKFATLQKYKAVRPPRRSRTATTTRKMITPPPPPEEEEEEDVMKKPKYDRQRCQLFSKFLGRFMIENRVQEQVEAARLLRADECRLFQRRVRPVFRSLAATGENHDRWAHYSRHIMVRESKL